MTMVTDNINNQIQGVELFPLRIIADDRGAVLHMLRNDSESFNRFGECYFSEVLPGSVKAWKKHTIQTQNFAVPVGRLQLVIFDGRETSTSFRKILVIELGRPDKYFRVVIPPGLWYGFTCISIDPALLANCADFPHDKNESLILNINDPSIPFFWNLK